MTNKNTTLDTEQRLTKDEQISLLRKQFEEAIKLLESADQMHFNVLMEADVRQLPVPGLENMNAYRTGYRRTVLTLSTYHVKDDDLLNKRFKDLTEEKSVDIPLITSTGAK